MHDVAVILDGLVQASEDSAANTQSSVLFAIGNMTV